MAAVGACGVLVMAFLVLTNDFLEGACILIAQLFSVVNVVLDVIFVYNMNGNSRCCCCYRYCTASFVLCGVLPAFVCVLFYAPGFVPGCRQCPVFYFYGYWCIDDPCGIYLFFRGIPGVGYHMIWRTCYA